jgi:hypothetical protein
MENEFEYYLIARENNDQYPLLVEDSNCPPYTLEREAINNPRPMEYRFGKPTPRKPKMVDYHSAVNSVISKKLYDVLAPMNIKGVQLIPALINGNNNEIYDDYWYVHIYNYFPALDREKSNCRWDSMGVAYQMRKIVLNEEYLKTIPLEERLVFFLSENRVKQFFHKSVVDAIMDTNPEGLRFHNVREWQEGLQF